ncbi:MAG TPA: ABC transporter permease [Kiloniellales bacterium]|jgi:putative spermidine/putrescine transport system permease protein
MATKLPRAPSERIWTGILWSMSVLVLFFLVAPIIAIIPLSFSSSSFLTYPLPGFSLEWYDAFLGSERWMRSLKNSVLVGSLATLLAMALGVPAAIGLTQGRFPLRGLIMALVLSPMIVPVVIIAVGIYFFFAPLGLTSNYFGLVIAHAMLGTPFVVVAVSATLAGFDRNLIRAAASMGAPPLRIFRKVILPLILPGVVSGGLFAFATSFDEVILVLFIAGPEQATLPRQMFNDVRESINPTITAVASILIAVSIVLLTALEMLRRRGERLRGLRN